MFRCRERIDVLRCRERSDVLRCRESNLDALLFQRVLIHCSNDLFRLLSVKMELREIGLVNVD